MEFWYRPLGTFLLWQSALPSCCEYLIQLYSILYIVIVIAHVIDIIMHDIVLYMYM